jgi:hypothetical protein
LLFAETKANDLATVVRDVAQVRVALQVMGHLSD